MSSITDNKITKSNANATNSSTNNANANTNTSQQPCPHGTNCRFQDRVENPCPKSHVQIHQPCPHERHGRGTCSRNMRGDGYCLFTGGHRNTGRVIEGTVPMQFFTTASRANQQPRQSQYAAFEEKRLAESAAISRDIREKRAARAEESKTVATEVATEESKTVAIEESKTVAIEESKTVATEESKTVATEESKTVATEVADETTYLSQTDPAPVPRPTRLVVVGEATWFQAKDNTWVDVSRIAERSEKAISAMVNNPTFRRLITSQTDPRIVPEPVVQLVQVRPVPTVVTISSVAGTRHYMKSKDERWYDVTDMFIRYSSGEYFKPVPQLIWTHLHNDISQGRIQVLPLQPF